MKTKLVPYFVSINISPRYNEIHRDLTISLPKMCISLQALQNVVEERRYYTSGMAEKVELTLKF